MSGPDAGNEPSTASSRRRHDVFISYSRHDKDVADAVCAALEAAGIPCWIGPRDTQAGAYGRSIMEAIRTARMLVLVLSPHADSTPNVLTEVAEAFDRKLPLLPFRLVNFAATDQMRFYIRTQHWIDAFPGPAAKHIPALVKQVKFRLRSAEKASAAEAQPEPAAPGPSPSPPAEGRKRRGIAWALSATAGALGISITVSVTLLGPQVSDPGRKGAEIKALHDEPPKGQACHFLPVQVGMAASDPDCDFIHRTAVLTLETATDRAGPSRWSNARTGRSGTLTIIATEVNKAGERCRRFETTLQGPKLDVKATGTACFSENQWRMSGWHEYTKKTREP